MSIKHDTVTVGTSATALTTPVADQSGNNYEIARSVRIENAGSVSVFLGGNDVTSADYGMELAAGEHVELDLGLTDVPYGVVASGTADVRLLHLGV